jgi:hypothetical protein
VAKTTGGATKNRKTGKEEAGRISQEEKGTIERWMDQKKKTQLIWLICINVLFVDDSYLCLRVKNQMSSHNPQTVRDNMFPPMAACWLETVRETYRNRVCVHSSGLQLNEAKDPFDTKVYMSFERFPDIALKPEFRTLVVFCVSRGRSSRFAFITLQTETSRAICFYVNSVPTIDYNVFRVVFSKEVDQDDNAFKRLSEVSDPHSLSEVIKTDPLLFSQKGGLDIEGAIKYIGESLDKEEQSKFKKSAEVIPKMVNVFFKRGRFFQMVALTAQDSDLFEIPEDKEKIVTRC